MSATPPWEPPPLVDPPAPTREQLRDLDNLDRAHRIGRTTLQVGTPAAAVVIATWVARLAGLDLDPGPGTDMPADVVAAWVALSTAGLAALMNRRDR